MRLLGALLLCTMMSFAGYAQKKRTTFPSGVPVKESGGDASEGTVDGNAYENKKFNFKVTVPNNWLIAGPDFEKVLKENGHDIGTDAVARTGRPFEVLMTAFRSERSRQGAVLRVTAENLAAYPQVRDAVDYFDAITAVYASVNLPPDFSYSAVKAEALGSHQFAYLDTAASVGRKRLYATVRNGWAIMFTLSYFDNADLQAIRGMLANGDFPKRSPKN